MVCTFYRVFNWFVCTSLSPLPECKFLMLQVLSYSSLVISLMLLLKVIFFLKYVVSEARTGICIFPTSIIFLLCCYCLMYKTVGFFGPLVYKNLHFCFGIWVFLLSSLSFLLFLSPSGVHTVLAQLLNDLHFNVHYSALCMIWLHFRVTSHSIDLFCLPKGHMGWSMWVRLWGRRWL